MSLPKLGIDISKKTLEVALVRDLAARQHKQHQFLNTPVGFAAVQAWLVKQGTPRVHAVLEATGAYGDALALALTQAGHVVSIVNPAQIKAFAQSELQRNKTDRADALLIARFAWKHDPAPWVPPTPAQQELTALLRHLDDLIGQRTQVTNRLTDGRLTPAVRQSWETVVATLERQITQTKQQIKDHFDHHPTLKAQRDWLDSIPGIGPDTAARLLAEMPHLADFASARTAAADTGLTPKRRQSGTSLNAPGRLSKMGNARIRYALYFPALAALRVSPEFQALKARLLARGKTKMQIIAAAMHKLVRLAYGVVKHRQNYVPNYANAV